MIGAAQLTTDGLHRLPVTATRPGVASNSEYNEHWNLLTVSLLASAGAVQWDFSFADVAGDEEIRTNDRGWLTVRLIRGDHLGDHFWHDEIEPLRQTMVERARMGLVRLRRALRGDGCTGVLIADSYRIAVPADLRTECLASCGGCRWCRRNSRQRWASPSPGPAAITVGSTRQAPLDRLAVTGAYGSRVIVCVDPDSFGRARRLRVVVRALLSAGDVQLVVAPDNLVPAVTDALPAPKTLAQPVIVDSLDSFEPVTAVGVRTLIFLPSNCDPADWLEGSSRSPLFVLCGPADLLVEGGTTTLAEQDGAYSLADVERLL
jgi:hypothetical protein